MFALESKMCIKFDYDARGRILNILRLLNNSIGPTRSGANKSWKNYIQAKNNGQNIKPHYLKILGIYFLSTCS
jgi:hypothetical protein